jgi:radical SAM protein with 4Fe4S-binding SPASM domain
MRRMARILEEVRYNKRLYGGLAKANAHYSPTSDMARMPFPQAIQLQTINACQAACIMCPYPSVKDNFPRGRMDDDLFDKVTDEIARQPEVSTFIPMLQNEPFLDKRLFEKIARFKQRTGGRVAVELVTNGAFLTDENIARMRDAELDILDVSLDAINKQTYEKIRVGLDYDAVMAGVERVIAAKLPKTTLHVRMVLQRGNVREAKAFARRWRERGVAVFTYMTNDRAGAITDFRARIRPTEEELGVAHRIGRAAFRRWIGHCPIPFATTNILHDGSMLVCVHDWNRNEVIGNVHDSTIAELWNGDRMKELRRLVSERRYSEVPACQGCSLWRDGWV